MLHAFVKGVSAQPPTAHHPSRPQSRYVFRPRIHPRLQLHRVQCHGVVGLCRRLLLNDRHCDQRCACVQAYCGADLQTARLRTALVFVAIIPVLTILPLIACWLCNRGCRARGRSTSVAARTETTKSEAKLVAAEQAAARLHSRVQGFLFVIGWLLFVVSITPVFVNFLGFVDITPVSGAARLFFCSFMPVGLVLLALAIRPTDRIAIRRAVISLLLVMLFLTVFLTLVGIRQVRTLNLRGVGYLVCGVVICPAVVAILGSTFSCRAKTEVERMPSRQQLLRLWLALRFLLLQSDRRHSRYLS